MALFLISAPFATFAILMLLTTVKISLAAGALVALGLLLRDGVEGRTTKMVPVGALAVFLSLAGYHMLATSELSPITVRLAVDGSMLVIALASVAIQRPFTLQYAREMVDAETRAQPEFLRTNYVLTGVWSAAFVLMIVADIVSIYLPSSHLWVGMAIAFAASNSATYFTRWYPKHVRAGLQASTNTAAA